MDRATVHVRELSVGGHAEIDGAPNIQVARAIHEGQRVDIEANLKAALGIAADKIVFQGAGAESKIGEQQLIERIGILQLMAATLCAEGRRVNNWCQWTGLSFEVGIQIGRVLSLRVKIVLKQQDGLRSMEVNGQGKDEQEEQLPQQTARGRGDAAQASKPAVSRPAPSPVEGGSKPADRLLGDAAPEAKGHTLPASNGRAQSLPNGPSNSREMAYPDASPACTLSL